MEVLNPKVKKGRLENKWNFHVSCWIDYYAQTSRKETTSVILPLVYLRNIPSYLQQGGRTFEAMGEEVT